MTRNLEASSAIQLQPVSVSSARRREIEIAIWAAMCLLAPMPLALKLGKSLWEREQYQFFPLILAGAAYLAWERWDELPGGAIRAGSRFITFIGALAGLSVLAIGSLLYVRSASGVSFIVLLLAIAWRVGGWPGVRAILAPAVLLATIVPPPGRQDQAITLRLQQWAVTLSSHWLDSLHVPNLQSGSVIEIPGRRLLVEQACSGINSLMSVLAFTLLFGLWKRRPIGRIVALLPVGAAFVLGGNVLRITAEAWLKVKHNVDVLEGTAHQLLGMVVFAGCIGLVISADALLGGRAHVDDDAVRPIVPAKSFAKIFSPKPLDWILAGVCVLSAVAIEARVGSAWATPAIRADARFELPDQLAGWTKVNRGAVFVERPQTEAAKSFVWNYRLGESIASVAIDYPFTGFHELTICYGMNGWTIARREPVDGDAGANGYVHVRLTKPAAGADGDLSFTLVDERGQTVTQPADMNGSGLGLSLAITRHYGQDKPSYQMQTLLQSFTAITPDRRAAAAELFAAARATLIPQLLAQLSADASTK